MRNLARWSAGWPLLLEQPADRRRGGKEQLPEADHDRPAKRLQQVGLVIVGYKSRRVADLRPAVEDIVDLHPELRATEPGMLDRHFGNVAGIGELAQVEGAAGREMQIVAVQARYRRAAAPVGADARAKAIVRPAALRLDFVSRRSPD